MTPNPPTAALNPSPLRRLAHTLTLGRSVLRLRPFDTSTADGRALERYRRVALTAGASALAKGVQYLGLLLSVPLTIGYLGPERYGLWMTLSAIVTMLAFADLGLGFGLMNAVATAHGNQDDDAARSAVWSVMSVLGALSAAGIALFAVAYPWIPWNWLLSNNLNSPGVLREAGPALAALFICFALGLPLQIISRVQMGFQEGFETSLWSAMGSLLSLGALLAAIWFKASLVWLVLSVTAAPLIAHLLNWIFFLSVRKPVLLPRRGCVTAGRSRAMLTTGFVFFVIQLSIAVGYQSHNLIITKILGLEHVAVYAVTFRLFLFTPMILSFVTQPLWPAYGEALARADVKWIRKTLWRSFGLGLLVNAPPTLFLMFFGDHVVHWWTGRPDVTPTFALRTGFALWAVLNGLLAPLSMFLSGLNVVKFQVVCSTGMAVFNIAACILFTRWFGVTGCIYATVIAQTLFLLLPAVAYVPKLLARLERGERPEPSVGIPVASAA